MQRVIAEDELSTCHVVIHGASLACAGISAIAGEGAAIGADTWFLRGTQGLMFTKLASVLRVPLSASTVYAFKEMWSGAVLGVGAAKVLISWLGIGAHAATAGVASAPVTAGVRGVNSLLSTVITEKMGWGYVNRVENSRMTLAAQIEELGTYAASKVLGKVTDVALDGVSEVTNSEAVKSAIEAIPKEMRQLVGVMYSEIHDLGIDEYGSQFLLCLLGEYQGRLLAGKPLVVAELVRDAFVNTAAYVALDRALDSPATKEVMEKRAQLRARIDATPQAFKAFTVLAQEQLKVLEHPTRDLMKQFKDKGAMGSVAGAATEAIKCILT